MIYVLHVENDADIREITKISLELFGDILAIECASGEDALTVVEDFVPDVFLIDVMMPGMIGLQTLEKMREMPSLDRVPVIFMTAIAQVGEQKKMWNLGASDVISKPFDAMALGEKIKSVVGSRV
jgi:CheY-like chemotaxis protein